MFAHAFMYRVCKLHIVYSWSMVLYYSFFPSSGGTLLRPSEIRVSEVLLTGLGGHPRIAALVDEELVLYTAFPCPQPLHPSHLQIRFSKVSPRNTDSPLLTYTLTPHTLNTNSHTAHPHSSHRCITMFYYMTGKPSLSRNSWVSKALPMRLVQRSTIDWELFLTSVDIVEWVTLIYEGVWCVTVCRCLCVGRTLTGYSSVIMGQFNSTLWLLMAPPCHSHPLTMSTVVMVSCTSTQM